MTRKEIEKLPFNIDMLLSESLLVDTKEQVHKKITEVCNLAIKALEQEPCEEHQREFIELVVEYPNPDLCIYSEYRGKPYFSIKYRENGKYIVGYGSYKIEMISQWIKEYFMPSIQPKPKTGHWIEKDGFDGDTYYNCSECGESWTTIEGTPWNNGMKYCPNCGAKMESEG